MATFYVDALTELVTICGEDATHILKSKRKAIGDYLTLSDGKGLMAEGEIIAADKNTVTLKLGEITSDHREPKVAITLLQAMPKGDKPELIIQKATELGVHEIIFFLSGFCVSRPDDKSFQKKLDRYNKVALEAAKQCGRGCVPRVEGLLSFKEAVAYTKGKTTAMLYEHSTLPFRDILAKATQELVLVVGSEGGFSEEEVTSFLEAGGDTATLGKRILRCETAPLAALSAAMFYFGEF